MFNSSPPGFSYRHVYICMLCAYLINHLGNASIWMPKIPLSNFHILVYAIKEWYPSSFIHLNCESLFALLVQITIYRVVPTFLRMYTIHCFFSSEFHIVEIIHSPDKEFVGSVDPVSRRKYHILCRSVNVSKRWDEWYNYWKGIWFTWYDNLEQCSHEVWRSTSGVMSDSSNKIVGYWVSDVRAHEGELNNCTKDESYSCVVESLKLISYFFVFLGNYWWIIYDGRFYGWSALGEYVVSLF